MSVTEEMLLTIRQIQESLKSDMTDIMQGENANSFEAYWEILKQLQQILQKSGHVIRNAEKREQRIAMLYHQIQSEDDLYAYYEAFRLYLDDVREGTVNWKQICDYPERRYGSGNWFSYYNKYRPDRGCMAGRHDSGNRYSQCG